MDEIIGAMTIVYASEHIHSSTKELLFSVIPVSNIKIPKSYLGAIHDSLHVQ
jgi:hypothetical protein